ncbi:MATE family efflux transporter [Oscillospiraceae bacterium N12]|jgi:putative MATE family efflux protein|uniref:Multidrug-efflux transporter n=1 Tax=Jilunia laotingensis TaxID=2763675 RepID=A0A926IKJ1_9BACT|nr:MATE family efflux transporter [Jilunia laotingensis]MBC8593967.1 MATE family efflux transporter [Jilunia laotingensis]
MLQKGNLTQGGITGTLLRFTLPMIAGSFLQQCYNIADTLIVGQFIGAGALAAVGSAYTLMVFLISIMLGLSMGSGTVFSLQYGAGQMGALHRSIYVSSLLIGAVTFLLNLAAFLWLDPILRLLQVPQDIYAMMYNYLWIIFYGIPFTFIYNFYAALLRAVGDAVTPLWFLAVSVVLNIGLDLFFILRLGWGIEGAAIATVVAQGVSALGIMGYTYIRCPELRLHREDLRFDRKCLKEITSFSTLTCVQQSVMNFGILMVQGLVNSFGTVVMAAFAAAIKIDSFAYMPVQEFGNAFSTFIAQNYGAKRYDRIRKGVRSAFITVVIFSLIISVLVFLFAKPLMLIFVRSYETDILSVGIDYLRIEGSFYCGIGILFLLYGYYRAIRMPGMSVILTVVSLGIRVVLSYWLASIPSIGVNGIWWSIPIGWFFADLIGIVYYKYRRGIEKRI